MRVALVHDSLNPCGGAERLALAMAKALKEGGHHVDLYVIERTDWGRVKRITPYSPDVVDNEYVLPPGRTLPSIYSRFAVWLFRDVAGMRTVKRREYDLVIVTKQLAVPVFADIVYMHFPDFVSGFEYIYYPHRYLHNVLMRIYTQPSHILSNALISLFKRIEYRPLVLTNSKFSAGVIRQFLGVRALVLYPPVDVERYLPLSRIKERKRIVLTISRIEPVKGLDIIPEIAKHVKSGKFIIVGSINSLGYYRLLASKIKAYGLEDSVKIIPNASEKLKAELMSKAMVYLHPMRYEHFGIAVVEAMAAGLIPVVHKSGGPWTDVVEMGKYGKGFTDAIEAAHSIISIFESDEGELQEMRTRVASKAIMYGYDNFKKSLFSGIIRAIERIRSV